MKPIIIAILFFLLSSCGTKVSVYGVVTRIYEAPSYKAYTINYHVVVMDTTGIGYDLEVGKNIAAQYKIGDTAYITGFENY